MDYALNDRTRIGGVFQAVRVKFQVAGGRDFLALVQRINDFRNTYVAHQEQELTDRKKAEQELIAWIQGLRALTEAL